MPQSQGTVGQMSHCLLLALETWVPPSHPPPRDLGIIENILIIHEAAVIAHLSNCLLT